MGETAIHRALECVDAERDAVAEREAGFEAFVQRVRDVPTEAAAPVGSQSATQVASTPAQNVVSVPNTSPTPTPSADGCETVRRAFAETILPHSDDDDKSLVETIAAELTEDIAVALASDAQWTPALKETVLQKATERRRQADLLQETLETETQTLADAAEEIDEISAWLQTTAEESLFDYGFEELRTKHDRLETFRTRLETLLEERQRQFSESTNRYGRGGTSYRTLVSYLYTDGTTQYPVLSTGVRLYEICGSCQRTVRTHLTRRV
ncbi:DUF7260 family protein [Halopiger djelfimassiliensis]|uniref:DUF7260 family protein n=1 Tax=Halopiger djelfimassiliensis TaxID=1293047 RepID=UPI000677FA3E|nr:hypothetical protein [Halopiger djelfimassiliensis]